MQKNLHQQVLENGLHVIVAPKGFANGRCAALLAIM